VVLRFELREGAAACGMIAGVIYAYPGVHRQIRKLAGCIDTVGAVLVTERGTDLNEHFIARTYDDDLGAPRTRSWRIWLFRGGNSGLARTYLVAGCHEMHSG
jgi:hypothetical protein